MRRIYNSSRILARAVNPFVQFRGIIDIKIDDLAGRRLSEDDVKYLPLYDLIVLHVPEIDRLVNQDNHDKLDEAVQIVRNQSLSRRC